MRLRPAVAAIAVAVFVASGAGAWLVYASDDDPWPPDWYVTATKNQDRHLATWKRLRRPAVNRLGVDFPPTPAKLDLMRYHAVAVSTHPEDSRPTNARVYFSDRLSVNSVVNGGSVYAGGSPVYVLALHGKFTTADIRRPPGVKPSRMMPRSSPMVIIVFDAATMDANDSYQGREVELSPLGESIELDLDEEPF